MRAKKRHLFNTGAEHSGGLCVGYHGRSSGVGLSYCHLVVCHTIHAGSQVQRMLDAWRGTFLAHQSCNVIKLSAISVHII